MKEPLVEMRRVLRTEPVASTESAGWPVRLQRWRHGPLHGRTEAMSEHVVMTFFGPPRRIECREGLRRVQGLTSPGTITLIPSGLSAHWDIHGTLDVVHLDLPDHAVTRAVLEDDGPSSSGLVPRVASPDPVLSGLLGMVANELDRPGMLAPTFAEEVVELIGLQLARAHTRRRLAGQSVPGGLSPRVLQRVRDRIEDGLQGRLSLAELAQLAGVSRAHFVRAFAKSTGLSPHRYVLKRRIERARALLATTDRSMLEVALESGFGRADHFASSFRRWTGTSPSRFRREMR